MSLASGEDERNLDLFFTANINTQNVKLPVQNIRVCLSFSDAKKIYIYIKNIKNNEVFKRLVVSQERFRIAAQGYDCVKSESTAPVVREFLSKIRS